MTRWRIGRVALALSILLFACATMADAWSQEQPISNLDDLLDSVLADHVTDQGLVNYLSMLDDGRLDEYLARAAEVDTSRLGRDAEIAFWINLYNAGTLKLIVDHYPVKSIRRITPVRIPGVSIALPKINSPWKKKFLRFGDGDLSLDYVEHQILRKKFDEPRIHFAIVCAAMSCPKLRSEAFRGGELDAQLQDQGVDFLNDSAKNRIPSKEGEIKISKIFKWFRSDFGDSADEVQTFISRFVLDSEIREKLKNGEYRVRYLKYNWRLNKAE